MLTKNEITALNLSPTKKDFVQIWNELLEVAGRLSERWDPTSTNESDPGIVILKALTGIADKLNYNIDKNTLEAFMPTAAQEESMRKLCDMLGYNVKYYRSAETTVNIKYYNSDPSDDEIEALQYGLVIPKFTTITNSDQDINYFTTNQNPVYISTTTPSVTVSCMEGQIVKCESTTDNNVITANQISDSNRFYLPEHQIAENGIFVYNVVANNEDGDIWEKVDNLNIQARGSRVFKFGYDSYEGRPYLEFPDDYSELINDGLFIYYARTSGANGNVSTRTLTQLELPSATGWDKVSAESFSVENSFSATTGANIETIDQAYNNFKKTIGTFETLVTCRDYMNKIYTMTSDDTGKYLVSNALVADIRTDINRAVTICSCDDAGIFYKESSLVENAKVLDSTEYSNTKSVEVIDSSESIDERKLSTANKPVFNAKRNVSNSCWFLGSADGLPLAKTSFIDSVTSTPGAFNAEQDGNVVEFQGFWWIEQGAFRFKTVLPVEEIVSTTSTITKTITNTVTNHIESSVETNNAIDHFDLVLYPFKSYNQIRNNVKDIQAVYDKSFEYTSNASTIKRKLDQSDIKTIAHNIISPRKHDIVSINNYLRLNAIIGTTSKITTEEGVLLIEKIKIALANAFNMRELDFGEEIPFDSILNVIENADTRISVVSLAEPALYTTFSVYEGDDGIGNPILREYAVASDWLTEEYADSSDRFEYTNANAADTSNKYTHTFNTTEAKKIYNRLAVRNILAGRIPLFKYNTTFKTSFSDNAYRVTDTILDKPAGLVEPNESNPFTIYVENGIIYTGQWSPEGITYTKTYVPDDYINNVITKDDNDDTNFTYIETKFEIQTDRDAEGNPTACISNIELLDGEFIKFRAPNFITDKTYPAYVNYHLKLNRPSATSEKEASAAKASTIYSLITDKTNGESWRDAVFAHFENSVHKKKFTLSQIVYGKDSGEVASGDITITVDNNTQENITPEQILDQSGFVRMVSGQATLKSTEPSVRLSSKLTIPDIYLTYNKESDKISISTKPSTNDTKYILAANVFNAIKTVTDMCLVDIADTDLPDKDWTISYDFEYIPFELASLASWEAFIKKSTSLLGYSPITEYGTSLWRIYSGSYQIGKYILSDGVSRLMPFTSGHFGLLDANRLDSVYIVRDLGADAIPDFIRNDEEYQLRAGEYLYIEYTPSSTTEDGTSQEPIKEVHKQGTIIKPSGFDGFGLLTAAEFEQSGKQANKTVTFSSKDGASGSIDVGMYSLGANEQISIRELSKVVLDGKSLPNPTIYVYKNFNDCDELEKPEYADDGKRINNSYTLKDGEYIFYTDQNKAEFAYFTSGTEVTLEGKFYIPKCELIDIATIFDSGIQNIPWAARTFAKNDSATFQEYQYITLGPNDILQSLFLYDTSAEKLDATWKKCSDASYTTAGSDELVRLSNISLTDDLGGNGWEACSVLELNASPNNTQTLRTTDNIETSVTLYKTPASGIGEREEVITLKAIDKDHPLSFKTNISCLSNNGKLHINDIYTNADNVRSFELKILSERHPAIIRTKRGKLVPCADSNITDITAWDNDTTRTFGTKSYGEIWTRVPLYSLTNTEAATEDAESYDNALKLSVSVLPNTYGIFSIYLNYAASDYNAESGTEVIQPESWIYLLPGAAEDDITILNAQDNEIAWEKTGDYIRLKLRPQINCIRVNKTCDLFIKTSFNVTSEEDPSVLTSALYFDDLRLVDCRPIEYTENGEKKLQKTQGLNLAQIGYLDTADTDPLSAFDMQIRKKLRKEYTEEAVAAIDERAKAELKNLTSAMSGLQTDKPKLQQIVDFLAKAKAEINTLVTNADEQTISQLFTRYKELYNDLEQEKALQNALADNKNITDLEKQLADLLSSFGGSEDVKQKLYTALDDLELAATSKASTFTKESLSKGTILDDFEAVADAEDIVLVNDLKLFSLKEVNSEYASKLTELASAIEAIDNSEAKDTLIAILDDLNITKHSKLVAQIQNIVKEHQEALLTLLDEAQTHASGEFNSETNAYEVDYAELRAMLVNLREYISAANINDLLSELNSIANSGMANSDKYSELVRITNELSTLLSTESTDESGTYASLLTATDRLIALVQTKINDNAIGHDSTIVDTIDALYTSAHDIYVAQLNKLLVALKSTLSDLEDDYSKSVESLREYENDMVQSILSTLDGYKSARLAQISSIESFGTSSITEAYLSLPYGTLAVLAAWPAYMKRTYAVCVAKLYRDIRKAINSSSVSGSLVIDDGFYANKDHTVLRQALANAANLDAFKQLFNDVKTQVGAATQNAKRAELINSLGALVTPSSTLYEAFNTIKLDSDLYADRNAVLKQLIKEWQNSAAVVEKQRILTNIVDELTAVIKIDAELVEISAKLLCPSILLFPVCDIKDIASDDFYSVLYKHIYSQKNALLNTISGFTTKLVGEKGVLSYLEYAYTINNSLLLALKSDDLSKFDQLAGLEASDAAEMLLTEEFVNKLLSVRNILSVQNQLLSVKSSVLIKLLQSNLVTAWQAQDGTWLDNSGNTCKPEYLPSVNAKRTNDGIWKYADDTQIKVRTEANDGWLLADSKSVADKDLDSSLNDILEKLLIDVSELSQLNYMSEEAKAAHNILWLETQLLNEIKELDRNREFYYNVPVEANVVIDFNESEATLNTLMNPTVNYDINNVNNNFVISKIDINYLNTGLQIARSSKLS